MLDQLPANILEKKVFYYLSQSDLRKLRYLNQTLQIRLDFLKKLDKFRFAWPELLIDRYKVDTLEYQNFIDNICAVSDLKFTNIRVDNCTFAHVYNNLPESFKYEMQIMHPFIPDRFETALQTNVCDSINIKQEIYIPVVFNNLSQLTKLSYLSLNCHVDADLLAALQYSHLSKLDIILHFKVTNSIDSLCQVLPMTGIKILTIQSHSMADSIYMKIGEILPSTAVEQLTLRQPDVHLFKTKRPIQPNARFPSGILSSPAPGKDGIEALANGLVGSNVRMLDIDTILLQEEELLPLLNCLPMVKLENFSYDGKWLGPDSTLALIKNLPISQIRNLEVRVDEKYLLQFLESLSQSKVKRFIFEGFKSTYFQLLTANIHLLSLETLELNSLVQLPGFFSLVSKIPDIKELSIPIWALEHLNCKMKTLKLTWEVSDFSLQLLKLIPKGILVEMKLGSLTNIDLFVSATSHLWYLKIHCGFSKLTKELYSELARKIRSAGVLVDICWCINDIRLNKYS
ncbi:hypothetical protein HDV01_001204 [Terramyces sp. JEL0728]|nr:hypothetical protein HDV01_001204 [Terramyces sp. JEL0728]